MKSARIPFYFVVLLLFIVGISLSYYRHVKFDVPFTPGEIQRLWSIEAKVAFDARGESVKVSLAIPDYQQPGFKRLNEHTASAGYGLSYLESEQGRRAEWTIRQASGAQVLYYRLDVLVDKDANENVLSIPDVKKHGLGSGPYDTSAADLLEQAIKRSADAFSLTRELINEFEAQRESAEFLQQKKSRIDWMVLLLHEANVPARQVLGLVLEDGRRRQKLLPLLQVFDGENYLIFDLQTGNQKAVGTFLLWESYSQSLIDVIGGYNAEVNFSMIEQELPVAKRLNEGAVSDQSIFDFSIHTLPLEEQALFKGILLIPVGVLVVVFLRVLVGLRTSGTFMPVLIALSFIQTSLITGIVGFILIVGTGLIVRSYLSHLNLLLVARISAVIIFVIILIAGFSVIAYQMGLSEGLKITFFPMVILSWTIERMSILWEEEGPQEVLVQGGGSLIVALITYMMLTNDLLRHLTFNFLGLQLVFMALVLMLGNYTGYRLLEFRRFRPLSGKASAD
ncbi:MAG: inactive transglutaminase family protein [Agarilytica sp.]